MADIVDGGTERGGPKRNVDDDVSVSLRFRGGITKSRELDDVLADMGQK